MEARRGSRPRKRALAIEAAKAAQVAQVQAEHGRRAAEAARINEKAEAAMRKALGLFGGSPRQRHQPERTEAPTRLPDRFGSAGPHRRRFVQDGDVPVTVLRREPGQDATATRTGSATAVPTACSNLRPP